MYYTWSYHKPQESDTLPIDNVFIGQSTFDSIKGNQRQGVKSMELSTDVGSCHISQHALLQVDF